MFEIIFCWILFGLLFILSLIKNFKRIFGFCETIIDSDNKFIHYTINGLYGILKSLAGPCLITFILYLIIR